MWFARAAATRVFTVGFQISSQHCLIKKDPEQLKCVRKGKRCSGNLHTVGHCVCGFETVFAEGVDFSGGVDVVVVGVYEEDCCIFV
jgi:hypothetical protein